MILLVKSSANGFYPFGKNSAQSSSNVLIEGESGTGKELFAQAIHNASSYCDGPFVAINRAALPRELIESELFGYEEGAYWCFARRPPR